MQSQSALLHSAALSNDRGPDRCSQHASKTPARQRAGPPTNDQVTVMNSKIARINAIPAGYPGSGKFAPAAPNPVRGEQSLTLGRRYTYWIDDQAPMAPEGKFEYDNDKDARRRCRADAFGEMLVQARRNGYG